MGRAKLPRKSTSVDMTAMCDVAFLLLSFFILATKFKPPEVLTVSTPNSVSTKPAPEKDVLLVTIDKEGKVYFSMSEASRKKETLEYIKTAKGLQLTPAAEAHFLKESSFVGVPFSQFNSYFSKSDEEVKNLKLDGIPCKDSTNNELIDWLRAALQAYKGEKMNLLVKGDNDSKFPSFKSVIYAFKKNEQFKFQMVTNPEGAPEGTELSKKILRGEYDEK
jgi:biopolymer transport protein ExbD